MDRDPEAVAAAKAIGGDRFSISHARFGQLSAVVAAAGLERVDGVLFDLGVSSPQLEDSSRGFSFKADGPLDMRMDTTRGHTAAQWLEHAAETEIREVIATYGEERFAKQIARALVAARSRAALRTTGQLAQIVAQTVRTHSPGQDPATRTFQALRIFVNQELEELSLGLRQALALLAAGARLVVISFHSLEDRIVKNFMRDHARPAPVPKGLAIRESEREPPVLRLLGKPTRPEADEIALNPRSRSAVMRVAERLPTDVARA
jgi:16S rRNA (cytosine1402-N4)-methyltransferase